MGTICTRIKRPNNCLRVCLVTCVAIHAVGIGFCVRMLPGVQISVFPARNPQPAQPAPPPPNKKQLLFAQYLRFTWDFGGGLKCVSFGFLATIQTGPPTSVPHVLGASPFLFNHCSFQKPAVSPGFGWFPEKIRIPGKNGNGR